jgi:hypothetical protein
MNNERIQVGYIQASNQLQTPEILITGGDSIKIYDTANQTMGGIVFQDSDFIFYKDINGNISKTLRNNPEAIEDGTIAHNSVVVHKSNVNETISGSKTFTAGISAPNLIYNTGNQTISGTKTFVNNQTFSGNINVSGTGIFNSIDLNNIDNLSLSGVDVTIQNATVDLNNSTLINAMPQFVNESANFIISGNDNGRVILANSSSPITGTIVSGNPTGFNTTIIQINSGIQITGSGAGVVIQSYNNQFRTAGPFATISLLHTGNNRYIMYGNTI